ncbi:MAG: TIGR04211 family SH3 domain-containing protein [Arhodomonas sp.]|nr:TIGR04211 family SH3 domain-containing protein [Arhodomonas sp.]
MRQAFRLVLAIVLIVATTAAMGQAVRYVTDEFRINLRSGAGGGYRIIELLPTGTELQLLDSQGDWTQVRTPAGETGWVPSQYLSSERPAADRLAAVEEELTDVRERNRELSGELEETREELSVARERIETLTETRDEMAGKLEQAEEGLELAEENERLTKQKIDLERRIQNLVNETERLSDRSRQDWFVAGAGVLFAGMIIGIIVTRIRWKRRSSWGDL